jgi:adenine-specific DNA-methyltransferase
MEKSFELVCRLVSDFKAQERAYLSSTYQESQVRQDFIDKFFTALGWDVTHDQQRNPYQQEVKIENKVSMATSQRRADYAFSISPNYEQIKFFVETKKPSRSLSNADDYFQTIRYAWNSRTSIAVLTDFEEFHILDCRYKPNIKNALERKIASYHYADYVNDDTFAKIFHLFGREAVQSGSLETFTATLPKKGTKAASGLQPVDDAFLEDLDEYRVILAKAFKKTNEQLQGEELTEAVQRTIDRLVFIRFLEDKGIEDNHIIGLDKLASSWKGFLALSRRLEPKYNGLVFKPHRILDSGEFNAPDDKAFAEICRNLSDPSSPYDFNQIPISILGSIYERFLGKVVHATDKRVRVEEKPEVRKAGGVYYTPQYIVKYIVKETVGKLIEGKTPAEISKMAFADIACGSGSFLIEVYDQLLEYHVRYYSEHPDEGTSDQVFFREGILNLALKKKKEILLNNIYGVDIDYQATEVTQLSLYLKMLEHATMQEAHQFGMFKERILPDLRGNIVCGNSLIGRNIIDGQLFEYVDETKLKPMNYEDTFPEIMKRGGFEAIVGNPPYLGGREWKEENGRQYEYFTNNYSVAEYQFDIYALFWEKAICICKRNGNVGYITPNTWLNNKGSTKLRKYILANTFVSSIVDYSNVDVFNGVVVLPIITILRKSDTGKGKTKIFKAEERLPVPTNEIAQSIWGADELAIINIDLQPGELEIRDKILEQTEPLENTAIVKFGIKLYETGKGTPTQRASDASEHIFESTEQINDTYRKYLEGKDINRYTIQWRTRWLLYGKNLAAPREPNLFEGERLLVRRIVGERLICAFTDQNFVTSQLLQIVKPHGRVSGKYVLGILNSALMAFYFRKKYNRQDKTFPEIRIYELAALPIKIINVNDPLDKAKQDNIVKLVDQMLDAKAKLSTTKTEAETNRLDRLCHTLDRQIDEAVYALYGLTDDEINLIEGKQNGNT